MVDSADKDDIEASILTLFQIIDEISKGHNLEYAVSRLELLSENPYLLDNNELFDNIIRKYFNHDKDMKIIFQIIMNGFKKETSRLIRLLPNILLVLQKKKKVEIDREQKLNKFISKTMIITSLLAISLVIMMHISMNFLMKNSSWLYVYRNQRIITGLDITLLLINLFISAITGILLMTMLFYSLGEKKLLRTVTVEFAAVILLMLISYFVVSSILQ